MVELARSLLCTECWRWPEPSSVGGVSTPVLAMMCGSCCLAVEAGSSEGVKRPNNEGREAAHDIQNGGRRCRRAGARASETKQGFRETGADPDTRTQ